jgi:DNA (cytosine-5)-methyltransferase 1
MPFKKRKSGAKFCAVTLFSGGGIGDIPFEWGFRKIPVVAKCELLEERAALLRTNYPQSEIFQGDIWELKDSIAEHVHSKLEGSRPWLMVLSPPCQGMSSNGAGRISKAISEGKRSKEDERNRLILPGIELIENLKPDWFILENVNKMYNTVIRNENDEPENILEMMARRLSGDYCIKSSPLEFARYGVPQFRKRLVTIGCSLDKIKQLDDSLGAIYSPEKSFLHPEYNCKKLITLRQTIGDLTVHKLDGRSKLVSDENPLHRIPEMNPEHYHLISKTPEGETAFNNLTCNHCSHYHDPTKMTVQERRLQTKCNSCDELLDVPKIKVKEWICTKCSKFNGKFKRKCQNKNCNHPRNGVKSKVFWRTISGFMTSYRRMSWDQPANTITTTSHNFTSDGKGHPEERRVFSIEEILRCSTIIPSPKVEVPWNHNYRFEFTNKNDELYMPKKEVDSIIREVVGESIPPLAMHTIIKHIQSLEKKHL